MFKNNISKEFSQQIDKKGVIIHQKVRASKAILRRQKGYFWHSAAIQGKTVI